MVVNLIQFGVDNLDYNTLSNSKRFFVKGFNEFYGLDEDNETGDTQEILVYAIAKSLVTFLAPTGITKEWANEPSM